MELLVSGLEHRHLARDICKCIDAALQVGQLLQVFKVVGTAEQHLHGLLVVAQEAFQCSAFHRTFGGKVKHRAAQRGQILRVLGQLIHQGAHCCGVLDCFFKRLAWVSVSLGRFGQQGVQISIFGLHATLIELGQAFGDVVGHTAFVFQLQAHAGRQGFHNVLVLLHHLAQLGGVNQAVLVKDRLASHPVHGTLFQQLLALGVVADGGLELTQALRILECGGHQVFVGQVVLLAATGLLSHQQGQAVFVARLVVVEQHLHALVLLLDLWRVVQDQFFYVTEYSIAGVHDALSVSLARAALHHGGVVAAQ